MERCVVGNAKRPTQRKVAEQATWRCGAVELFADGTDGDGGDASGFEEVRERTDRTRTQWSDRREQHHVHAVFGQLLGARRPAVHLDSRQIELIAGERQVDV